MNVALVAGICVRFDAISDAVVQQLETLRALNGVDELSLFTQGVDRTDAILDAIDVVVVDDPWAMLTDRRMRRADLAVLHWGIAYELFDAVSVLPGRRRTAVDFHNVTPAELLTGADRGKAGWSTHQLLTAAHSDAELWTYSEYNRRTLLALGVGEERLAHVPISVERPPGEPRQGRSSERIDILTVGRAVPAKGLHVVVEALALLPGHVRERLTWTMAGNIGLSDPEYVEAVRRRVRDLALDDVVTLVDRPDRDQLWSLYDRSHVVLSPSFHEGLCVPVIEGYVAGCRAVGTTAGNLPFVVQPPDPVVPPGDPQALASALVELIRDAADGWRPPPGARDVVSRYSAAAARSALSSLVTADR